ncbi:hypothetical protein SPH9361_01083 [Sphingobium sp. CECT 9361]|nr:hypothetical protein SPH9361_01083 [Sphingobium sp. CECT 9361]
MNLAGRPANEGWRRLRRRNASPRRGTCLWFAILAAGSSVPPYSDGRRCRLTGTSRCHSPSDPARARTSVTIWNALAWGRGCRLVPKSRARSCGTAAPYDRRASRLGSSVDRVEQQPRPVECQHGVLPRLTLCARPHRRCRVRRHHLAGHQSIEQVPHAGERCLTVGALTFRASASIQAPPRSGWTSALDATARLAPSQKLARRARISAAQTLLIAQV